MPIYEYQCKSCGHELEALQKMSADPLTDCPECEEPALKKKISAAAFRLKGGGWYETDFKSGDKQRNIAKDDHKAPESKDSGKKESKKADSSKSDSGKSESKNKKSSNSSAAA